MASICFSTDGTGVWDASSCTTDYRVVPIGSLRALYASQDGRWDAINLGVVGSIREATRIALGHAVGQECVQDVWTWCHVHEQ